MSDQSVTTLLLSNLEFQEAFYIYRPIVFVMDADPSFEANFVLATLVGKDSNSQVSNSQKSTQEQRQRNSAIAKRTVQKTPETYKQASIGYQSDQILSLFVLLVRVPTRTGKMVRHFPFREFRVD